MMHTEFRERVKVLVVDDQPLIRQALVHLLERDERIVVVAEAVDGSDALHHCHKQAPDVVLMDIHMPRMDGIEATRRLRASSIEGCEVIMLTALDDDVSVFEAVRAGAMGYVLKDSPTEDVVDAVVEVANGGAAISGKPARHLMGAVAGGWRHTQRDPVFQKLTEREAEVLQLVSRGLTNHQVARQLFVAESTVKSHVKSLYQKLEVRDRAHLVARALDAS